MRIALDATPLTVPSGGTRRYVVELTRALAAQFPNDEFHLLSDQTSWERPAEFRNFSNIVTAAPSWRGFRGMWWSSGLAWESQRRGIEIFHGTDFSIPYLPLRPSVMMVHDLSPWKRGPARAREAGRVRSRTPYLLRMATMILTPTEAIRRELSRTFGVNPARIRAVPLAAASSFSAVSQTAPDFGVKATGGTKEIWGTKETWGTEETGDTGDTKRKSGGRPQIPKPYLLSVGTREPRKNIARLIEAWRIVKRSRPSLGLVLAGAAGADDAPYRQEPGLHVLGRLADIEIRDLLNRTAVFVYPSLYEGFGLPVVEAMQAGAAVITSRDPALVEVSASAAMHADATCTRALARVIGQVLDSEILRNRLREQGKRRASRFSWRATARRTRAIYVEAIHRF